MEGNGRKSFSSDAVISTLGAAAILLCIAAAVWVQASVVASATRDYRDFGIFYASSRCVLDNCDRYAGPVPNLNPPFTHWLTLPLAFLGIARAHALWLGFTLIGLGWSTWIVAQSVRAAITPLTAAVALGLWVSLPTLFMIIQGQVTAILLLPLTYLWSRERSGQPISPLIAPIVAWKPMLGVLAVGRALSSWSAAARLGLAGLMIFGVDFALEGPAVYRGWIDALRRANFDHRLDGSIWQVTRNLGVEGQLIPALLAVGLVLVTVWRMRAVSVDASWLIGLSAGLLASPKGWMYYGCWLMPPGVGLWQTGTRRQRQWLLATFALILLPLLAPRWPDSLYGVTYGCAWIAGALPVRGYKISPADDTP